MAHSKQKQKVSALIIIAAAIIILLISLNLRYLLDIETKSLAKMGESSDPHTITIYYYPSRLHAAQALTYYFGTQGYEVKMLPASKLDRLSASQNTPSYVFFNQSQFGKAMAIKSKVEKVLQSPVNAYRYKEFQDSPSIMMVFTEA